MIEAIDVARFDLSQLVLFAMGFKCKFCVGLSWMFGTAAAHSSLSKALRDDERAGNLFRQQKKRQSVRHKLRRQAGRLQEVPLIPESLCYRL